MPNVIKPKRKYTTGAPIASQLAQGELAINLFDKKIYSKDLSNNIVLIGSLNGSSVEKFKVANAVANDEAVNKMQLEDALANLGNLSIFQNRKDTNGYQKFPGGLIIQWGSSVTVTNGGGGSVVTYPIAFPSVGHQPIICNGDNNIALHSLSVIVAQVGKTGFGWVSDMPNIQQRINWLAIGF